MEQITPFTHAQIPTQSAAPSSPDLLPLRLISVEVLTLRARLRLVDLGASLPHFTGQGGNRVYPRLLR